MPAKIAAYLRFSPGTEIFAIQELRRNAVVKNSAFVYTITSIQNTKFRLVPTEWILLYLAILSYSSQFWDLASNPV